ncbi:hypothetical protein CPB85DRAFT_45797 [Mucidula mucida]|nr:hypothetical protein CPB85DRAFT_45797 [Mucidula mucida]
MISPSPTWPLSGPTPPTPVQFDTQQVFPRFTAPPPLSCCAPNEVVIALTTTVVIPDYARYYHHIPISDFAPAYIALGDGSLVTQPYIENQHATTVAALLVGSIGALFARNAVVSGDYLRRANVKKKVLFYILFASQLMGVLTAIPLIVGLFDRTVNCTAIMITACTLGTISLNLLITCILGYKAYRCLNDSRFVLCMLGLFALASFSLSILDLTVTRGAHALSDESASCFRSDRNLRWIRVYLLIQLAEVLFICLCFLSAVWKSKDSPLIRGRMSVRLSLGECTGDNDNVCEPSGRRGWWDYVPKPEVETAITDSPSEPPSRTFLSTLKSRIFFFRSETSTSRKCRKPSIHADVPVPQPPRPLVSDTSSEGTRAEQQGRNSLALSSYSRIGRYVPRMEQFREVMQDELCYTALISALCVVVAILAVIGMSVPNGLTLMEWISLNWIIISLLSVHSFGRVVRRNENDKAQNHYCRNAGHPDFINPRSTPHNRSTRTGVSRRPRFIEQDADDVEIRGLTRPMTRNSWNSIGTISSSISLSSPPTVVRSHSEYDFPKQLSTIPHSTTTLSAMD